jgi:hypothetical protein
MSHINICFAHSRTILILALGIVGIVSMSCYTGLVIYAAFHDCDPVSAQVCEINSSAVTLADIIHADSVCHVSQDCIMV